MTLRNVSLDDKYTLETGRIFITGTQALVRLPMMQHLRDKAAGYDTAGYISGYRGSPLGGYDQQLWSAKKFLAQHQIVFQPGVQRGPRRDRHAGARSRRTSTARTSTTACSPSGTAKGPGVDRTGDAFRHGNLAGTHPLGGVLVPDGRRPHLRVVHHRAPERVCAWSTR